MDIAEERARQLAYIAGRLAQEDIDPADAAMLAARQKDILRQIRRDEARHSRSASGIEQGQ